MTRKARWTQGQPGGVMSPRRNQPERRMGMNQGEHSANRMDTAVSGRSELNDGEVRLDDRGDPSYTSTYIVFDCLIAPTIS